MKTAIAFRRSALPVALVVAALIGAPFVARADKSDHIEARELLSQGKILPLSAILATVSQQVPGDVVEVELEHEDAGWQYEVKVLTATGEVKKLHLDARDGTVLKVKAD